jgi:hypothetical protein
MSTATPLRVRRRVKVGIAALALLAAMSACSGHKKDPSPKPSSSATATSTSSGLQSLENQLLASPTSAQPVASETAQIRLINLSGPPVGLTAQVLSVTVVGATTELHWQLKSADGAIAGAAGNWASGGNSSSTDTSQIAILDPSGKERFLPYLNANQAVFGEGNCVCSDTPRQVSSTPIDMYATYPAISDAASTVTIDIPGFAPMTNVPVTRP